MRLPNFFTSVFCAFWDASLPHSTSIMPPLAAFIMKFLSAALSLLPVLPAALAPGFGEAAGAFAPVRNGGYCVCRALLVAGRQSAPTVRTAIGRIVRCFFIFVRVWLDAATRH